MKSDAEEQPDQPIMTSPGVAVFTESETPEESEVDGYIGAKPKEVKEKLGWAVEEPPPIDVSPHVALIRSVDWASTSLGPMETWSSQLRFMCNFLVATPNPGIMFWGPELRIIYNEAYPPLVAKKHPELLGKTPQEGFPEVKPTFPKPMTCSDRSRHGAASSPFIDSVQRPDGAQVWITCCYS